MHDFVTSDLFVFITGICSILSLLISIFVISKVIQIDNSVKIKNQTQTITGNSNKTAGRDTHA